MKKYVAAAGLMGFFLAINAVPSDAFISQEVVPMTAQAVVGGARSASFTASFHPVASTATVLPSASLVWTGALPGGGWKMAGQVIQLQWNVTDINGGIQIYTDNTNPAAVPRFVDPSPLSLNNADSNPAGLLMGTSGTSSSRLPIAWTIKASTQVMGAQLQAADPNFGAENGAANRYQWIYLLDKNTPAIDWNGDGDILDTDPILNPDPSLRDGLPFANGDVNPFVNMARLSGIHGAQGPSDFFADPDKHSFVYFQADFRAAAAVTTYSTSRIIIEAYIQ